MTEPKKVYRPIIFDEPVYKDLRMLAKMLGMTPNQLIRELIMVMKEAVIAKKREDLKWFQENEKYIEVGQPHTE